MVHHGDTLCDSIVAKIGSQFDITDVGQPIRLLGMRLRRSPNGDIRLDPPSYIQDVLSRFNMTNCNPSNLPHPPGYHLSRTMAPQSPEEIQEMQDIPYGELVGALLWLSIGTQPDITQAVSVPIYQESRTRTLECRQTDPSLSQRDIIARNPLQAFLEWSPARRICRQRFCE